MAAGTDPQVAQVLLEALSSTRNVGAPTKDLVAFVRADRNVGCCDEDVHWTLYNLQENGRVYQDRDRWYPL